ncbi:copper resistance CopC/CopD family protein [Microbacterium sp. No. 7]|uniref:copper resistance CopC/CopD family protein n=1 Tax=Microbacterium sp. No. 7 TaxID=1714373 RepID=UPI0006D261B4|nr:copper resistance protein CopC [Microbacterium sp. No. 7]ALJ19145.1 hypothetical protein AOA12_04195 [Microbacterium sp. No. 7]
MPWFAASALAGVLLLVGGPASPAFAHATIVETIPAHGTELDEAPTEVRVTFSEAVSLIGSPDAIAVIDADGERVDAAGAELDETGTVLTIPLEDLPVGAYIASWRVVSADTHPVGGSIQFGYGVPASAVVAPPPPTPSAALALGVGLAKGVLYLGLALAFGLLPGMRVLGAVPTRGVLRAVRAGLGLAVIASLAQAVLQFLWIRSASGTSTDGTGEAVAFATSPFAVAVGARIALLGLAALVLARVPVVPARVPVVPARVPDVSARVPVVVATVPLVVTGVPDVPAKVPVVAERVPPPSVRGAGSATGLVLYTALGVAIVIAVVAAGHGGSGILGLGGSAVAGVATVLHALAAIAWLGGLVPLALVLLNRRLSAERMRRMPVWSLYAGIAVTVLGLSGLVQAVAQVGGVAALLETTYGGLLLAKLALVAAAVALAALGFAWTRRRTGAAGGSAAGAGDGKATGAAGRAAGVDGAHDGRPAPGQTARLRTRTRVEAGLVAIVVVISGVLSSITPAKDAWAPVATAASSIGPYEVAVEAAPARPGPQSLRLTVTPPTVEAPLQELRVVLRGDEGGELPVQLPYRVPAPLRPGEPTPVTFISAAVTVPETGTWTLTVTVVATPLEQYTADLAYDVR